MLKAINVFKSKENFTLRYRTLMKTGLIIRVIF
ncbi:hypothetical protein SAMN05444396_10621 [Flavobacterium segetis]|uniref:Uncharacterized protein n=1 Tax=Flavobacterium segetis TaxID=271157 RepID=A0A1M5HZD9_9FLAO|nr:hypothetical protein SAMN05444396_10621 [Flavobacterium segetis]